jgi:uncharacterized membrane protein YvbJ
VFLNEERNVIGDEAFKVALDYVKKNPSLGVEIGEIITAVGNTTDAQTFLTSGKYIMYINQKENSFLQLRYTEYKLES